DGAAIDVARDGAPLRALEVDLGDSIVLEDCDTLLPDVDRDEELPLRLRQRCAPRGLAAPALRSRTLALATGCRRLALGPRPRSGLCLRLGRLSLGLGGDRLLRSTTAATATATTSRPGGARLSRFVGGLGAYRFRCL